MTPPRALLLASSMLILGGIASAEAAQKVGVAAAVNPDAFASGRVVNLGKSIFFNEQVKTSANGLVQVLLVDGSTFTVGPNSNLVIDKFVYDPAKGKGEMVATFSKGALRFVGGKLSKKQGGVTVKTPEGALAIRGGIAQIQVSAGGSKFLFDFGDQMQLKGNDGKTHTIFQPGNLIDVTGGSPFVRPTSIEDTQYFLTQLASKPGQSGGAGEGGGPSDGQTESGMGNQGAGGNPPPPVGNNETNTQIFTVKIEDATSDKIEQQIVEQIDNTPPPIVVGDPPPPPLVDPPPPPPPGPPQVQLRVLSAPAFFTSFTNDTYEGDKRDFSDDWGGDESPGGAGIVGGDDFDAENGLGEVTSDDFVTTAAIADGFLTGSVQFVAREFEDVECGSECGYTTVLEPVKAFAFSFSSTPGIHAAFGAAGDVVEGVDELHVENFIGSQVVANGFFAYQMYGLDTWESEGEIISEIDFDDPLLIASGQEYVLPSQGKLHSIELLTDPRENQDGFVVPFASAGSMPENIVFPDEANGEVLPAVSNLLLLEKDSDKPTDESLSVWLQTSFYIATNGESGEQENFVVLALGGVEERDGFDALVGQRRGGSLIDSCDDGCMDSVSFAGGIATLAGGEGAHLMGADGVNVVVGADSTGDGHEIAVDRPLDGYGYRSYFNHDEDYTISPPPSGDQYATYHIGTQNGGVVAVDQTSTPLIPENLEDFDERPAGAVAGYAVGMVQSMTLGEPNIVMSDQPSDVTFSFDDVSNTLSAQFRVYDQPEVGYDEEGLPIEYDNDPAVSAYEIGFGGIGVSGKSAFIDNQRFGAIENVETTKVVRENGEAYSHNNAESYLVSGDQLEVTNFFPDVFEETSEGSGVRPFCQNCDFIKWGAWGTRVQFGASQSGSYDDNVHLGWWVAGDVTKEADLASLGNKSANYAGHAIGNVEHNGDNYVAAGDLDMIWNFGPRSGSWNVTNFDGNRSFGADISAADARAGNHFGNMLPTDGPMLEVNGSFVNAPAASDNSHLARGVIGNFRFDNNDNYRATGIFAGSGIPGVSQ